MNKFEIVKNESIGINRVELYRIRALIDFGDVCAGEFGGYIQHKRNLSQSGNAWVYGDAWVRGDAHVYGNARVYGDAVINGDNCIVWSSNVGSSSNGTLTVFCGKEELLATRGCFYGTLNEFCANSAKHHSSQIKSEYSLLAEMARLRLSGEQNKICGSGA